MQIASARADWAIRHLMTRMSSRFTGRYAKIRARQQETFPGSFGDQGFDVVAHVFFHLAMNFTSMRCN